MTATAETQLTGRQPADRLLVVTQVGFFLSGATGLVYEVVWLRLLGVIFGSTTLAVSVDLTAFFGGLALGSYLFGRLADRWRRLFRVYALMEFGVAALCLASPFLLGLVRRTYLAAARDVPFESPWLLALQFGLCMLVLVPPTLLMGGTLPVLSKAFTRRMSNLGRAVGKIYAINTFGAVLGVFSAAFLLLPAVGLRQTIYLAAAFNALIGLTVLAFEAAARRAARDASVVESAVVADTAPPAAGAPAVLPLVLLIAFGFSGFAAMALEVAWTRAFYLVIGSTVYAFAIILIAFLLGIALGSVLFARLWARRGGMALLFGGVLLAIGLLCLFLSYVMGKLPLAFIKIVSAYKDNYPLLLSVESLVVLGLLIVPTMLMGMTFPILSRAYVTDQRLVARGLGKAYAANTLGGIIGSFAAGFAFVPWIGVRATILLACATYLAAGLAVIVVAGRRRVLAPALGAAVVGALAIGLLPGWARDLMSAGVYLGRSAFLEDYLGDQVLYYGEGSVCTIAVIREPSGELSLRINGKPDASNTEADLATEVAGANLPYLLAARRDRALVIGLGSGITAGALLDNGVGHLDVLEIEPHVVEAARFFAPHNYDVVNHPRASIIVGDGRNYVAATAHSYDIITSEPSNVWVSGMSTLFTVEHFRACRQRLRPGGLMCQWVHLYAMGPENLATIINTFRQVFPDATLWSTYKGTNDILLIGHKMPHTRIDAARIEREIAANPRLEENLRTQGVRTVEQALGALAAGPPALAALARHGLVNRDNRPVLEFRAPRYLYVHTEVDNARLISSLPRESLDDLILFTPEQRRDLGFRLRLAEAQAMAYPPALPWARARFESVLADRPDNLRALFGLAQVARSQGKYHEARRLAEQCLRLRPGHAPAREFLRALPEE